MTKYFYFLGLIGLGLTACQNKEVTENKNPKKQATADSLIVYADLETEAVIEAKDEDAADDPAFWFNAQHPAQSLILGSNKKLGLEVYDMQGQRLAHYPVGRLNNIDVIQNWQSGDSLIDIVAGSNRTYKRIDVWQIDSSGHQFKLISDSSMRSEMEDVYGFCLYYNQQLNKSYAFINSKTGAIEQWELQLKQNELKFQKVRYLNAGKQVEGMVADPESGKLYVGVEEEGILVFGLEAVDSVGSKRIPLSGEDNPDLKYDIEGLSIYHRDSTKYLIASSQGNNRYALFDLNANNAYLGFFSIGDSLVDGCEETDGIDAISKSVGKKYPRGFMLIQDGFNFDGDSAKAQNFKLIDWRKIARIY